MDQKGKRYNCIFSGFLVSIFIIYFCFRPQNSEWYRIITADGLGYYSYLPAKFIYHDDNYTFNWFNDVYNQYYKYNSFAIPTENFSADFHGKTINKYYPGLSFLWMPFFLAAHAAAEIFGSNANGMSLPYQMAIGFATIFYTCIGLWYLRKLLQKLLNNEWIALLIPILVFFGTNLFSYAIYFGTMSHAYSFTFITLAFYFAWCFFNENENKFRNLLLFAVSFLVIVFMRPFNIVFLLGVPAFFGKISVREFIKQIKVSPLAILIIVLILYLVYYSVSILYTQTGQFFPNTFYNEKFHFERGAHLFDILFSYHMGWFLYVPMALLSFFALIFIGQHKKNIFLFLLLLLVIYLYSNWWSYGIFMRTIVDFTGVVGLLLAYLLYCVRQNKKVLRAVLTLCVLCVFYFQLKAYQFRNNILDYNYTYSDYFYRNFFTLHPVNNFPVHPKTVLENIGYEFNYDEVNGTTIVDENKYEGKGALKLFSGNHFSEAHLYKMPDFTSKPGFRKIRTSFYVYFTGDIKTLQLVYKFYNGGKELAYIPYYISGDLIRFNQWDYKEIGCDVPAEITAADSVNIFFWNNEGKDKAYIDKVKHEFFLTDSSMEMVP